MSTSIILSNSQIAGAFTVGMSQGWANPEADTPLFVNGWEVVVREFDYDGLRWRIEDSWKTVDYRGSFFGHTLLVLLGETNTRYDDEGIPVWQMSYAGGGIAPCDAEEITAVLKEVLFDTYRRGIFNGGRGPEAFTSQDGRYAYVSTVRSLPFRGRGDTAEEEARREELNFSTSETIHPIRPNRDEPIGDPIYALCGQGMTLIPFTHS